MNFDFRLLVMKDGIKLLSPNDKEVAITFYEKYIQKPKGRFLEIAINPQEPLFHNSDDKIDKLTLTNEELNTSRNHVLVEKQESGSIYKATTTNQFSLPYLYDVIMIPFGGILSVGDRKTAIGVLKSICDSLKTGGEIIIDLFSQNELYLNKQEENIESEDKNITIFDSRVLDVDFFQQKVNYLLSLENWQEGKLVNKERKLQPFIWFGMKEFKLVLERVGFSEVEVIGDYLRTNEKSYSESKVFTFVAKKA
ncbi:hypothetical protein JOC75_004736 [Metabacillus crassostreae]|uniref:hypothetical protein n=1 Tax=Metabacillus crassostreae TaxID=929098 RepID=UPI001959CD63|nr:hypothetical protein [Metabacillus crassostreae]MBM7606682.1 hypothetical protein [Metabacillus crassostreae]